MARIIQQWTRFTRNSFQKKPRRQELLTRWPLCDYTFPVLYLVEYYPLWLCLFYFLCDWHYQSLQHTIRIWLQFKLLFTFTHHEKVQCIQLWQVCLCLFTIGFLVSLISNFAFSVSKLKFGTLQFTAVIISFFCCRCESQVHLLALPFGWFLSFN